MEREPGRECTTLGPQGRAPHNPHHHSPTKPSMKERDGRWVPGVTSWRMVDLGVMLGVRARPHPTYNLRDPEAEA